ncbi:MAG: GNAT family N-acetyltransferase [Nitrospiraceae bacterium]
MTKRIDKLQAHHVADAFDCGQQPLNPLLKKYALLAQSNGWTQTYLGLVDDTVIGYYALAVGSVTHAQAYERMKKGLAHHPIPMVLLARLAGDLLGQKHGVGAALLKNAALRTLQAADIAGIREFIVHATEERVKHFYERFDFMPSPTDSLHLFILLKDLRKIVP